MKVRFGIQALLVIVSLVAAFFPFRNFYNDWFIDTYSGYHLHDVLGYRVSNGDSLNHVSSLFDRSESHTEEWVRKHLWALPDYEPGDEFHLFHMDGGNVRGFFQFREDAVVNHDNAKFHVPYSQVQHFNDSEPSLIFRHGALPVYAVLLLCVFVIYFSAKTLNRKVRKRRITN